MTAGLGTLETTIWLIEAILGFVSLIRMALSDNTEDRIFYGVWTIIFSILAESWSIKDFILTHVTLSP